MSIKIFHLYNIVLSILILFSCQSGTTPPSITYLEVEYSTFSDSPKLGVAILQKVQKQKLPYYLLLEMVEMISYAQENLESSDWKPNQSIELIPTYLGGSFDDTQDYLSIPKKNILEIHTNLTYKSGLGSEVFHVLTFSLIPRTFDYNFQMKSYFYDSDGIRHELMTTESFSIVDKQGKFVDHDAVDNNAEQQIYASLAEMIQKSHVMILEKKYSHSNFEPIEKEKNTSPFLFSIDYISCHDNYAIEYGVGVRSTAIFNNKEYSFCNSEIRFLNQSDRSISIDSKDFFLVSKKDQIHSLESIPVIYIENRGNGNFLRTETTRNFRRSIILYGTSKPSDESIELFFLVPRSLGKSNFKLRWTNPDSEPRIVEGWIGDLDLK